MKKLIVSLAVGLTLLVSVSSCRWIHETFYSVEGCAEWYAEELYDAAVDEDKADFIERMDQFNKWLEDLSDKDKEKAVKAIEKWQKNNRNKDRIIDKYNDKVL